MPAKPALGRTEQRALLLLLLSTVGFVYFCVIGFVSSFGFSLPQATDVCFDACECWPVWATSILVFFFFMVVTFVAFYLTASLYSKVRSPSVAFCVRRESLWGCVASLALLLAKLASGGAFSSRASCGRVRASRRPTFTAAEATGCFWPAAWVCWWAASWAASCLLSAGRARCTWEPR